MNKHPPLQGVKLWFFAISIAMATFMEILDISITNVSIPNIAGELNVTPYRGTWIISAYALGNSVMILLSGFLAHRFGQVRIFLTSVSLFVVTSALCGLAPTFTILLIMRVLQGVVSGPIIPLSQSLLLINFPRSKQALAIGIWSTVNVIAPMFGPLLGGVISDFIGWRWIFYVNVPVGLFSLICNFYILRKRESERYKESVNLFNIVFLIIGIGALQLFLDQGNEKGWLQSQFLIKLLITAIVSLSFFILWSLTSKHPLVDLRLYARRNFAIGSICSLIASIAIYGGLVVYPIWLETELGYTAIWAGLALMPFTLFLLVGIPLITYLIEKHKLDLRILAFLSFVVFIVSCYLSARYNTQASFVSLLLPRFIIGVALSLFFVPVILIALSGLPHRKLPRATSLLSFQRVFGIGVGSSIGIAILQGRQKVHYDHLLPLISHENQALHGILERLREVGFSGQSSFTWIQEQVESQSYMLAVNDFFLVGIVFFLVLSFLIWFAKPPFLSDVGGIH